MGCILGREELVEETVLAMADHLLADGVDVVVLGWA
jgi:hypothetical protein